MRTAAKPKMTEERLEEIRKSASENATAIGSTHLAPGTPSAQNEESYYGLPAGKYRSIFSWAVSLVFPRLWHSLRNRFGAIRHSSAPRSGSRSSALQYVLFFLSPILAGQRAS
jgi:hypothetical protein